MQPSGSTGRTGPCGTCRVQTIAPSKRDSRSAYHSPYLHANGAGQPIRLPVARCDTGGTTAAASGPLALAAPRPWTCPSSSPCRGSAAAAGTSRRPAAGTATSAPGTRTACPGRRASSMSSVRLGGRGGAGDVAPRPGPPRSRSLAARAAAVASGRPDPVDGGVDRGADQDRERGDADPQQHGDGRGERAVDRGALDRAGQVDPQQEAARAPTSRGPPARPARPRSTASGPARTRGRASSGRRSTAGSRRASTGR